MKIEIKNRWHGNVILECESGSIREALEKAVNIGANLSGANLSDADLRDANLRGANLSDADLRDANLSDADLRGANLSGANLSDADLRDANLRGANLSDANLRGANLRGANLSDANLSDANLSDADLSGANLRGANLSDANLSDANLSGANLETIRTDFFDVLLRASTNGEVPFLIEALKSGKVNGSTYEGACSCLVGTLAIAKKCKYTQIPDLMPNSDRPAERFFLAIKEGDTPETNSACKIALEWAEDFQRLMARAKAGH